MRNSNAPVRTQEERRRIRAAEFAWDLVLQLAALREARGLSQEELAKLVGTKQQAISRMENPAYDRQSLGKLREVAKALNAFVDVVLVPDEKANVYLEYRYQPALDEEPPFQWVELTPERSGSIDVPVVQEEQVAAWYSSAEWNDAKSASLGHEGGHGGSEVRENEPVRVAA